MKLSKKTATITSFVAGALIFTSTAFADIISISGYEQLKNAAKFTAASCSDTLKSFTEDYSGEMKVDGKTVSIGNDTTKYDNVKLAMESSSTNKDFNRPSVKSYGYQDKEESIYYNDQDNSYNVEEYKSGKNSNYMFRNIFKENRTKDAEKIIDALVGNLKDLVVVSEKPDGSKEFSGTINESQVPAVGNALLSFLIKDRINNQAYNNSDNKDPYALSDDIYLKQATMKVTLNKDGIVTDGFMTGDISGKDDSGKTHDAQLNLSLKIHDINSTVVNAPDLSGKQVDKHVVNQNSGEELTQEAVGKYKTDIVIEKDNKLLKIGEKRLEITNVTGNSVKGNYYEEYKKGYESYGEGKNTSPVNFEAVFNKNNNNAEFTCKNANGKEISGNISIETQGMSVYFNLGKMNGSQYDSNDFIREFDN